MNLSCQSEALIKLEQFAQADRHSVLIEGPDGSGKTYLAASYSKMLGIEDLVSIDSNVSDLRTMLDNCYNTQNKLVVCIEGLDDGQLAASYVILKFLEEPQANVYIVVTCSNIYRIPDTIISRSVVATISHPTLEELSKYAEVKYADKSSIFDTSIKNSLMSFNDVDVAYKLTSEQLQYYNEISNLSRSDTVSNLSWKLGHYPNNEESNLKFVFRSILSHTSNVELRKLCISTLRDIESKRMGTHAVLAKFAFDYKYGV